MNFNRRKRKGGTTAATSTIVRCAPRALLVSALILVGAASIAFTQTKPCFRDVSVDSGLNFTLRNDATSEKRMIETMPGGLAIFDYDGDGKPDLFFTNGAEGKDLRKTGPAFANRLFHNEGSMKFRDVTSAAGISGEGYAMGAAAADFDNDGRPDLFVAGVYHNTLYRNVGNGKFEDITAKSGIKSDEWSVAAGWFDFDNDGLLDLLVVNYGAWNAATERYCGDKPSGVRVYCHPKYYEPRSNQLYRNRGDGTFEDVTTRSGIGAQKGRGMSVAFADYDRDGLTDFFITNDNLPNFLFHNKGGGKFEEVALLSGVALLDSGKPVASMGTDFRDYDNDDWPDIVVVALTGETYPVFHNEKGGTFKDVTFASGVAGLTTRRAGWGAVLADFDNDGWKDLFTSNSHVNDLIEKFEPTTFKQANSLFVNQRNGKFNLLDCEELNKSARAHRGAAAADLDGDGRLELVATALNEPVELWHNELPAAHWINIKLEGMKSNRDGIGAIVRIGKQAQEAFPNAGYASTSLTGVHFGLGEQATIPDIEIRWPSGTTQRLQNVKADQRLVVRESSGKVP